MATRFSTRVGNNAALTTGPVGGLIQIGVICLVLGGLVAWGLGVVVSVLKLLLLACGVLVLWGLWWVWQESRAQKAWLALPEDERERVLQERDRLDHRAAVDALKARHDAMRSERLTQRPR